MHSPFITALLAFGLMGCVLAIFVVAVSGLELSESLVPRRVAVLVFGAVIALLGYLAFWTYFASATAGKAFAWSAMAVGMVLAIRAIRRGRDRLRTYFPADVLVPIVLAGVIGIGYIALLYAYGGKRFFSVATERFTWTLPYDNEIPNLFANRLWDGVSPKRLTGDWLSSDRPPLQTGWTLLFRPVLAPFFGRDTIGAITGVWFQLLWVPALWSLLRTFGCGVRHTTAIISCLCFSGFFLINTIFTWPKLCAASFVIAAFLYFFSERTPDRPLFGFAAGGFLAALGFLCHGGAAFSFLGLVPIAFYHCVKDPSRSKGWLMAGLVFALTIAPWLAYQRFYDPPGDRLLKWHLAGQPELQAGAGFVPMLIEHYRAIGWEGAWDNRVANFRFQSDGSYLLAASPWDPEFRQKSSNWEFFATTGSFGFWLLCLAGLPWVAWRQRRMGPVAGPAFVWIAMTWFAWVLLIFIPRTASVHQGSYVTQIVGLSLLTLTALRIHPLVFSSIAALQIISFFVVWVPAREGRPDVLEVLPSVIAGLAVVALVALNLRFRLAREEPQAMEV